MRIVQVGKYYYPSKGGIESHVRELAIGLRPHVSLEVVVAGQPQASVDIVDEIPIERLATPATLLATPICPGLIAKLRDTEADIVHLHLPNPWSAVAYLLSGCRLPLVIGYHSDIVRQSLAEPVFRPILLKLLDRASAIISASPDMIQHSPILQRVRKRCVVIPYGIPEIESETDTLAATDPAIRECDKAIILAVGRLVYYKGFEYLIRAMADVDASLVIIGQGPLKTSLIRLASDLGVSAKVTFLDRVENVHPYFRAADIFVLPSVARSEAFGIVQLEAMAAGKPVINTHLKSGVPFVSPHGVTGLTVPPADATALATAINRLLSDTPLRDRYGRAGKQRVRDQFTSEKMIARMLHLYRSITLAPHNPALESFHEKSFAIANN